jgi:hypothetical protein
MRHVNIVNLTPMDLEITYNHDPLAICKVIFPASLAPVSLVRELAQDPDIIGNADVPVHQWRNIITGNIPPPTDNVLYIVPQRVADLSSRDDLLVPGIDPVSGSCILISNVGLVAVPDPVSDAVIDEPTAMSAETLAATPGGPTYGTPNGPT